MYIGVGQTPASFPRSVSTEHTQVGNGEKEEYGLKRASRNKFIVFCYIFHFSLNSNCLLNNQLLFQKENVVNIKI